MAESLRQVAEKGAVGGVDHLGVEADVVGVVHERVHRLDGLLVTADAREGGDTPEAARDEGVLLLLHAGVAVEVVAGAELKESRQRVVELETENQALRQRIDAAKERLRVLAARLSREGFRAALAHAPGWSADLTADVGLPGHGVVC